MISNPLTPSNMTVDRLQPRSIGTGRLAGIDADLAAGIDELNGQIIELIFAIETSTPSGPRRLHQLQITHRGLTRLNHSLIQHVAREQPADPSRW